jgi:hypothetical protein
MLPSRVPEGLKLPNRAADAHQAKIEEDAHGGRPPVHDFRDR